MQTVEWESFYMTCSWTEMNELIIIVVEYLIVSKLGSNYVSWFLRVCLYIWVTYKPRHQLGALHAHVTIINLLFLLCRGLYTELIYAIIPTYLVFLLFAVLLSLHVVVVLFFTLVMSCFSSRCMAEVKFAIYHKESKICPQASSVDIGWRITDACTCLNTN